MKSKGGRPIGTTGSNGPSKYTAEFIEAQAEALILFVDKCLALGKPIFFQRFAFMQGYSSQRFSEWVNPQSPTYNEIFSETYRRVKDIQETDIAEGALEQRYDAGFAFRALKNVSGWRDEQHLSASGPIFQLIVAQNMPQNRLTENAV